MSWAAADTRPNDWRVCASPLLGLFVVLSLGACLRLWNLGTWSLWEDEETTIFFSQQLDKPFPSFFPIFFVTLHELFEFTGISVFAGRALAAGFGVLSLALVFFCFRRYVGPNVALLAALLLAMNMGHLFWSQSIRYFTLLFVLQLLSFYWFLEGFEKKRRWSLVWSNIAFALALLTHFSALLQMPVFVGFLMLIFWRKDRPTCYDYKGLLIFCIPLLLTMAFFVSRIAELQKTLSGMVMDSARDPVHILATVAGYVGLPLLILGLASPYLVRDIPKRITIFFLLAGMLPILELVTIAKLNIVNVVWYYAFFLMIGLAVSSALTLAALHRNGWRWTATLFTFATVLYYSFFLVQYNTTMFGDRPRWQEAVSFLRQEANVNTTVPGKTMVAATVPGVVAYYLGVPPGETMGHPLVSAYPECFAELDGTRDEWFVIEASVLTQEKLLWLKSHCALKAEFSARTGPKDRSIQVYFRPASLQPNGL